MQKLLYYSKKIDPFIRLLLLGFAIYGTVKVYSQSSGFFVWLLIEDGILIFLEVSRYRNVQKPEHLFWNIAFSLIFCMTIMLISGMDYIQIYYFFLLDDILNLHGKRKFVLVGIHVICLLIAQFYISAIKEQQDIFNTIKSSCYLWIFYFVVLLIFMVIHYFKAERERLKKLNIDLLKYTYEQRDYLIAEERNRISQELHDSIGHSLMAVLMNVRYLKAIQDRSQIEKDEQIRDIENLLKECISNLRKSIYSIKELDNSVNLYSEIQRIIEKFEKISVTKIDVTYDNQVDQCNNKIKYNLFKSIREAITNSMKHGNPTKIHISIQCVRDKIKLVVQDDGLGCSDIHKSYGLKGIAERAEEIGGKAYFESMLGNGFIVTVVLPGGEKNDTSDDCR